MNDISEFQQRAASVAVVKMLGGKGFSVCDLDAIAKTLGREGALAGKDYAALRSVHCVDWADMGPELTAMVREKCFELLGLPTQVIEGVCSRDTASEPAHKPAAKLRLAFWK